MSGNETQPLTRFRENGGGGEGGGERGRGRRSAPCHSLDQPVGVLLGLVNNELEMHVHGGLSLLLQ